MNFTESERLQQASNEYILGSLMLKKGDIFPQFNLENQNGEVISNETIKGNKTVLYFYPRDNTPTCTTEACDK